LSALKKQPEVQGIVPIAMVFSLEHFFQAEFNEQVIGKTKRIIVVLSDPLI
jgi:hypothetical protein